MASASAISAPCPMTTPTERAQVYVANALLPAALPTPLRSEMMPLLPTPCVVLLPTSAPPTKPSRADADERWDAHKPALMTTSSSSSTMSSNSPASSSIQKWSNSNNKRAIGPAAESSERWDAHKVKPALRTASSSSSSSSSNSPPSSPAWSSIQKRSSNKKRAISPAAASERWDAHKQKARQSNAKGSTGSNDYDALPRQAFYAGPVFVAAPEASMLPMPSFMVRVE